MKTVVCRNVVLGEGRPKICIPITAASFEELISEAQAVASCQAAEIVEWRADWYQQIEKKNSIREALTILRKYLGNVPILFTFRSQNEGGEKDTDTEQYAAYISEAAAFGVELIDIELSRGAEFVQRMIETVHKEGVSVIVSSHDFLQTPETNVMMERLRCMYKLGADICKLAVMPNSPLDTIRLMEATYKLKSADPDMLMITMSMSEMGSISRVCGEIFGSVMTFGTVGKASAPGQLEADRLRMIMESLRIQ